MTRAGEPSDLAEITALKYTYCNYLDDNRTDDLFGLFTEDAVLRSEGMRGAFEGRDEIREWCERATQDHFQSSHMALCPTIDVDGDEASGHWYSIVFIVEDEVVELGQGEYVEEYRLVDGEWRIAARTARRHVTVNLGQATEPSVGLPK